MKTLMTSEMRKLLSSSTAPTVQDLHTRAQGLRQMQRDTLERRKLSKFIDALSHYQTVLDVVSQCDFGGLTLIWGALKFGLIASKDYQEKLFRLTDAMIEIGLMLPRADRYRHAFPTQTMLWLVRDLYETISAFLREAIAYCEQGRIKKAFGTITKPFEVKFGDQIRKMTRQEEQIEKEAQANQACQEETLSVRRHVRALSLSNASIVSALRDAPQFEQSSLFFDIRSNLFEGFEIGVNYHEELATIFRLTSSAEWAHWLSIEQEHIPSRFSPRPQLIQAECDACDIGTCLQWISQARTETPHIVSAYVVWVKGMTAKAGLASIVLQMLQQRRDVLAETNPDVLRSANSSLASLWSFFRYLIKRLSGLMVYIAMSSVGEEEYKLVEKFVHECELWEGRVPVNVILIHPYDDGFAKADECIDSDGIYEVTPLLTTTDSLYHAVLLCLGVAKQVSDAVQNMVWDAAWREARYAVITIAEDLVFEDIESVIASAGQEMELDDQVASLWVAGMKSWIGNKRNSSIIREQIQRHLDGVDLNLPSRLRKQLRYDVDQVIDNVVGNARREELVQRLLDGSPKPLKAEHRQNIWTAMRNVLVSGARTLYSSSTKEMVKLVLSEFAKNPPNRPRQAQVRVREAAVPVFGWYGKWMGTFRPNEEIEESITGSIRAGTPILVAAVKEVTSFDC